MDEPTTDVIQGTLDMLILKTLSLEPMHGFGIARRIEQISRGVFKVNPGSLLTAFQRLERAGWLDAEWRVTENSRRAKFYSLTRAGRRGSPAQRPLAGERGQQPVDRRLRRSPGADTSPRRAGAARPASTATLGALPRCARRRGSPS